MLISELMSGPSTLMIMMKQINVGSKNTDMTFALQRGGGQDMTGKAGGRDGDTVELATKVIYEDSQRFLTIKEKVSTRAFS